jgi:hypothetical protein
MPDETTHMMQVKAYACNCGFRAEGPNVVQHMNDHIKVCPLVSRLYADETTRPDLTAKAHAEAIVHAPSAPTDSPPR